MGKLATWSKCRKSPPYKFETQLLSRRSLCDFPESLLSCPRVRPIHVGIVFRCWPLVHWCGDCSLDSGGGCQLHLLPGLHTFTVTAHSQETTQLSFTSIYLDRYFQTLDWCCSCEFVLRCWCGWLLRSSVQQPSGHTVARCSIRQTSQCRTEDTQREREGIVDPANQGGETSL